MQNGSDKRIDLISLSYMMDQDFKAFLICFYIFFQDTYIRLYVDLSLKLHLMNSAKSLISSLGKRLHGWW